MRKISFFAALVVAMTVVSCVEDINNGAPAVNDGAVAFEASFGVMGKAVLEPGETESKVSWEAGDQVSVLAGEGNYLYTAASAGYSTQLATEATDVPAEGPFYAVFPYDAEASLAGGVVTTTLPAVQTAVLGSFTTHLSVAQTTGTKLAFKNVCGLVKVTVSADDVTKVEFKGNNNEVVAGSVAVTVSDTPSWAAVAEQGATTVTLVPAGGTALAKGVYYFAVLPQTFEKGVTVTAYKGEEAWDVRNVTTPVTVLRSDIKGSNSFGVEGSGTEADPYILDCAQDMVEMRALAPENGETWFKMAKDIDMAGITDYVPVNYGDTKPDPNDATKTITTFERKIHFDGNSKTISNFSCDNTTYGGSYPSLFGVLYGSVKDLTVINAVITATNPAGVIGGYVGTAGKPASVTNVSVQGTVTSVSDRAGGVCGNAKEATFKNVSFKGTVTSTYTAKEAKSGGFAGHTETSAVFENCSADVVVTGSSNDIGGFVGKTTGSVSFKGCQVKAVLTSKAATKNRCGGFVGWNSVTTSTYENCHVLNGSTITNTTGRTSVSNGNFGGFIGFGDTNGSVVTITNCSADVEISVDEKSTYNSGFIGGTGYASTFTITGCAAKGSVNGNNYVGGFVGALQSTATISKCSSAVNIASTGQRVGGIVGTVTKPDLVISDCCSTGNITASGQQVGGILGYSNQSGTKIERCFATGDITTNTSGSAGIVGTMQIGGAIVTGCIAWNKNITCNRPGNTNWAPGAIVGAILSAGTYTKCYRRADMVLYDKVGAMTLVDHEDVTNGTPPLPSYTETFTKDQYTQNAYHGKAAAADATISSVARTLGWSTDIWDLSKDIPTLK